MKRFKELTEQLAEDYGAIYTYGSDLDSLGSGSYGVHNIGHPESLEKINQYVENFTKKLYFDPKQAIVELRAKLNTLGLDFNVTQQSANEGVYPLTMFGGSFGKKPDTPHNEWHKSDNISEKLGHGLELNIEFVRVGDGMYQVDAEIVPSGLDYDDVEEAIKYDVPTNDLTGKVTGKGKRKRGSDAEVGVKYTEKRGKDGNRPRSHTLPITAKDMAAHLKAARKGKDSETLVRNVRLTRDHVEHDTNEAVKPALRAGIDFKYKVASPEEKAARRKEQDRLAQMRDTPDTSAAGRAAQRMIDARKKQEESVETLEALSSDTLRSYVHKASGQVRSDLSTGKHSPKTNKRAKGVSAALSRLDARKQLRGAPKGSQRHSEWGKLARED